MSKCNVELVYWVKGSNSTRLVVIEPLAVNTMRKFRQVSSSAHEAGGVLIGERRGDSFVVKEATTPSPKDKSSRFQFIRRFLYHQQAVTNANRRTGGTSNYLGEWHTHPQDKPYPSSIDFKNWKSNFRNQESCLVSVVGRGEEWWALYEDEKFHPLLLETLNKEN